MQEAAGFSVSSLIELFTLDGTEIGMDTVYRFTNTSNANLQPVVYGGIQYTPFPIRVEGFDKDGKTSLPRPRLSVSNINGLVSRLLLSNDRSLDGALVTRTRVFARFLDATNWSQDLVLPSWVTPDPTAHYAPEPFRINRKVTENPQLVTWELCSPLEMNGVKLPRRQIIGNVCASWRYRQSGTCNYSGEPVADSQNRKFKDAPYSLTLSNAGTFNESSTYNRGNYVAVYSTIPQFADIPNVWVCLVDGTRGVTPSKSSAAWVADACPKTCAGCKLRFPDTPLRISAFPGVARADWIVTT